MIFKPSKYNDPQTCEDVALVLNTLLRMSQVDQYVKYIVLSDTERVFVSAHSISITWGTSLSPRPDKLTMII